MIPLVVVENPKRWPFELEGVEVVSARAYLVEPRYAELRAAVYNVCRSYAYQSLGYYVSLLAAARGHRPLPAVATMQALSLNAVVRVASGELEALTQRSLAHLQGSEFRLSVYFGRNVTARYDRLARALFDHFPAPFLRARFLREEGDAWRLVSLRPVATSEIPDEHRDFVVDQARAFFARPSPTRRKAEARYDMAVLWSEDDPNAPSDERALRRFARAAAAEGIAAEVVGPESYGRIAEYDALFIRESTSVTHHTFRFAHRAAAEGLVVIDDPESIIRCSNKVYQAELFRRHDVPAPRTLVVHDGNVDEVAEAVGLPCVLKRPDGTFSQGVVRVGSEDELRGEIAALLEQSELVVAQEFAPTDFDWRVGVLDRRPLWAARYHMARGHWQIVRADDGGQRRYGRVEALPLEEVPEAVVETAVRAASLMGDGLYGVDVKEVDGRPLVMEVNDNPNLESGCEDAVLKDELWAAIARWFRSRLDARGRRELDA